MNSEDLNGEICLDPKLTGVEKSELSPVPQQLQQHSSEISDLAMSQTSVSEELKSDIDVQHELNGKNSENDDESCGNGKQLSNSMNLDAQAESLAQQQQQLHRSISHQMPAVNHHQQQLPDSPASLDNLTVPNTSIFALMSKQQSRRDIKNTIQTKNSTNSGLHNLRGSLLGTSSASSEGVNSNSSNSKSIFSSSFNQDSHKETGIVRTADSVGSNSAGLDTPKKKTISLKKNIIKITNTTSTELKKNDFADDDLVVWDEVAYSELSKTYDIAQNISIGIQGLLKPDNLKRARTVNDQEMMIILPALVSVKTEEQIFTSFSNLDQNHVGNKISHFQGESAQDLEIDNSRNSNESKELKSDVGKSEKCEGQDENILSGIKNEKIESNLTSGEESQEGNEEGSQIRSILEKARKQENTQQALSGQLANQLQNQSDSDSTANQPLVGDNNLDQSTNVQNSGETQGKESLILNGLSNQTAELTKTHNLDTDTIEHSSVATDKHYDLEHTTNTKIPNILHIDATHQQPQHHQIESPRKMSQKEAFAERLSSLSRQSRMESGGESLNKNLSNFSEPHHYPLRFPIDLVCVIDTSGSMDGEPLDLVKETLLFLVDLLQQGDRICLIQFSTNAKRLTPLLSIETTSNRETIKTQIQNLNAKGGTNITQGMQLAFDVLKQRRIKNAISSVFLLSDGLNDGAENRIKEVLKQLNFYQNYSETNFTIQTFGFGKDHDPNLMDKISQLMDGNFYYIGDIHRIDECFIDALGGLFSVVSQNVSIIVKVPLNARSYFKIIKTFGDIWTEKVQNYEYSININQLISGVSKDFVFEVEIDANHILNSKMSLDSENPDSQQKEGNEYINLLEVELHARNVSLTEKAQPQEMHKTELLSLQEIINPSNPSNIVRLHYLRVLSAEGLEKCQVYAHEKKFDEGDIYVSRLLNELMSEPKETQDQLQKLITDLKEAQDTLRKKISESLGWHRMVSCKRMYMEQRSAGIDLSYQNSLQKIMVQRRQSIKHQALQIQMLANNNNTPKNTNESNGHTNNNKPPGQQHSKEEVSPSGSTNSSRSTSPVNSPKNN